MPDHYPAFRCHKMVYNDTTVDQWSGERTDQLHQSRKTIMAHAWQNVETGKRNYPGSALQLRNKKLQRAKRLAPVRQGGMDSEKFAHCPRVMTAAEYIADGDPVAMQINVGREAHLLVRDEYNDGEFLPVQIYDVAVKQERGLCELDLHTGPVLVRPDTLIYWK